MKINTPKDNIRPDSPGAPVTVKEAGNIIEIRFMKATHGAPIQKQDKDHGVDLRTGEYIDFTHHTNRAEDTASVAQSLRKLRDLINANLINPATVLWVTLTYSENMQDTERLYNDYRKFWQRFCRYLKRNGYPKAEYIVAAEPQARGAWHLHCLFLFPCKAPFVPNADMAKLWKNGFTKVKGLSGNDNPGLYLTAYLGDMELDEAIETDNASGKIKVTEFKDEQSCRQKKAIVKGARMRLYPAGFNLYRYSQGVQKPKVYQTTEAEAQRMVKNTPLAYEKTFTFTDDNGEVKNFINYRQYNKAKKKSKGR